MLRCKSLKHWDFNLHFNIFLQKIIVIFLQKIIVQETKINLYRLNTKNKELYFYLHIVILCVVNFSFKKLKLIFPLKKIELKLKFNLYS